MLKIHNAETGQIMERELTEEEVESRKIALQIENARLFAENEKARKRAEILERLGLTEDEAKLILG